MPIGKMGRTVGLFKGLNKVISIKYLGEKCLAHRKHCLVICEISAWYTSRWKKLKLSYKEKNN
jgi:hypothetical protein